MRQPVGGIPCLLLRVRMHSSPQASGAHAAYSIEHAPLAADCPMSGPAMLMMRLIIDALSILEKTCSTKLQALNYRKPYSATHVPPIRRSCVWLPSLAFAPRAWCPRFWQQHLRFHNTRVAGECCHSIWCMSPVELLCRHDAQGIGVCCFRHPTFSRLLPPAR